MLIKKYKNLAIAWKVALDPLGQGHLSKEEPSEANRIQYQSESCSSHAFPAAQSMLLDAFSASRGQI